MNLFKTLLHLRCFVGRATLISVMVMGLTTANVSADFPPPLMRIDGQQDVLDVDQNLVPVDTLQDSNDLIVLLPDWDLEAVRDMEALVKDMATNLNESEVKGGMPSWMVAGMSKALALTLLAPYRNSLKEQEAKEALSQKSVFLPKVIKSGLNTLGTMITLPAFLASLKVTADAAQATYLCHSMGLLKLLSIDLINNCGNAEVFLVGGVLSSLLTGYLTLKFGCNAAKELMSAIDTIIIDALSSYGTVGF